MRLIKRIVFGRGRLVNSPERVGENLLLENGLSCSRMTALDVGDEVGRLGFSCLKMYRISRAGGDDKFPPRWDHHARLQSDDDETSVGGDSSDDSNPL